MSQPFIFTPERRKGLVIHAVAGVILAAACVGAFILGLNQQIGAYFDLLLLLSLVIFAPFLLVLYRLYALLRAEYRLERDGLQLRWGLRAEDIPLPSVEWVRRANDLALHLPLPRFGWPGAFLGTVQSRDLGPVEFLASSRESLVLIATSERVYAISPADPAAFQRAYQRTTEMGSLTPLASVSLRPATYLSHIWADGLARWSVLAGLALAIALFVSVSLAIANRAELPLGFYSDGRPLPPASSEQMLLLPILGTFVFLTDLIAGLFLYRRAVHRPVAYLVWSSGALTLLILLGAALALIQSTV